MSKGKIIQRLVFSLGGGMLATICVFLLLFLTDTGDSTKSLEERHPLAWMLLWPQNLLSVENFTVVVVGNVLFYSTLIYLVLDQRNKSFKLP